MPSNFWKKLKRPIMTIAPMSGVTDEAFRRMFLKYGRPDVFWTEFVSTDGLFSRGREKILPDLRFLPAEHPIVAQIFGAKPDLFKKTAEMIRNLDFDGIDINMGCPNRDIEKQGAGAALIKNPDLAKQIIRAAKQGAGRLPVSVKTRIGYAKNQIAEWIPVLLKENLAALIVHLRARNEASNVPAHWELAQEIVKFRDVYAPETLIFGNGGVESLAQARELARKTGLDGIMIGRGVLGNPWFFSGHTPDICERMNAIVEHAEIFEKLRKKDDCFKSFDIVKKHFNAYATGFAGAKDFRERLMKVKNAAEAKKLIGEILKKSYNISRRSVFRGLA
ncbi:MAG: tRNA-dihydrouridine synthase [Candidatus Wildermuthbacteria bacterium]|nr:tRNA-dihydrouridine synthase [Candidatus Wildermuthbacteria bacterium]